MKQQMITEIVQKLTALMLPVIQGQETDLSINCEFLDASWGSGSRKISYETAIFLNEDEKQIFMYEKTLEIGSGVSFGASSDTTFQSGTTLFRKVKSIQYGPDGRAFDYNLDLGAIPKAVKDTAKQYGWKFKTVLSRSKACYPAGYGVGTGIVGAVGGAAILSTANVSSNVPTQVPPNASVTSSTLPTQFCPHCGTQHNIGAAFCANCGKSLGGTPAAAAVAGGVASIASAASVTSAGGAASTVRSSNSSATLGAATPQGAQADPKRKFGILRTLGFGLLSITTVLFFALMSVNLVGWLIGFATLFVTLILLKLSVGKGLFINLLIFLISFVTLFFVMSYSIPDTKDTSSLGNPVGQNESTPTAVTQNKVDSTGTTVAAGTAVDHSQSAFYIEYVNIDTGASVHYDSELNYFKGALSIQSRVILGLNTNIPYYSNGNGETQNDTNIIKATLNVTPVNVPVGNFVAYRFLGYDSMVLNPKTLKNQSLPTDYVLPVYSTYDEATAKEDSGDGNYILYLVGETQSVQLRFGTAILDILPSEDFSQKTTDQYYADSLALAASKGYTDAGLRHRVRISLLLESKNGKKHLIEFERDILPDGYSILTTTPGGTHYEEKSDGNPQNAKDDLFSKIIP